MEAKADSGTLTDKLGLGGLKDAAGSFASSLVNNGIGKVSDRVEGLTGKLSDFTEGKSSGTSIKDKAVSEGIKAKLQGKSPAMAAVGGALTGVKDKVKDTVAAGAQALTGGRGGRGSRKQKLVNIVEWVDVGVPVKVAYNQWTEFEEWSDFMKKVKNVEHDRDNGKVSFKGQVFLSHRTWESQIKEMVPDDRIIWKSKGQKGHLDGAVTFHEYGPRLTKICAVVEYYPQGLFEKTGQIWRAVGRRVRVELKRYVRHVMTSTILDPEAAEGWRGEIRDGEIVRTHEEVVEEEQRQADEQRQAEEDQQRGEEEPEEGEGQDEYDEYDEEGEGGESEGEETEGTEEEPEDEYDDEYDEGETRDGQRNAETDEGEGESEDEYEDEEEEEPEDEYEDEEEPDEEADDQGSSHDREPSGSRGRR
ncbi:SRPBCC family protein [Sinomonas susongensis]|uniref:SRPBCC family protein n=1 Tax=Sinomonas susongensis TaxID=1324851 RepID=UPI001107FF15|nr:SRPBCC family protein [Sinomonas susongensis]